MQNPKSKIQNPKSKNRRETGHRIFDFCVLTFDFERKRSGFTFIEILIVVAVLAVVVGVIAGGFSSFRRAADFNRASDGITAMLREARQRTVESRNASLWGVHFENSRAVLFQGGAFVEGAADNEPFVPVVTVTISSALQGGVADILFKRISGATDQWGTIILNSSSGASRVITIYPSGLVEAQ